MREFKNDHQRKQINKIISCTRLRFFRDLPGAELLPLHAPRGERAPPGVGAGAAGHARVLVRVRGALPRREGRPLHQPRQRLHQPVRALDDRERS